MQRSWRFLVICLILVLALSGVLWRLVELTVIDRTFLLKQSQARILRKVDIPAYRGMIVDRWGIPFAISTPVESIWANPQLTHITPEQLTELARILNMSSSSIQTILLPHHHRQFIYLKRGNPPDVVQQIKRLNISGIFFQREYRRYYPEGEVTAHIIGLNNIDDAGQEGLEYAYNHWLTGSPGQKEVIIDRLGHVINNVALLKKPEQGHNLVLSIDHRLQYLAYRTLKETVAKYNAEAGSAVILSVKTGEILAMVNQPSFNPNNRTELHEARFRNRAVTDMYEPGSVIKPFTVAFALQSGNFKPGTLIDTNPGWMRVGGFKIQDDDNNGVINLTQLLEKSSNIAAAKILLSLNPRNYWNLLHQFGFGERTTSGFPGEVEGRLELREHWGPSAIATLAYGYGMSVTALQLAHAYETLAAGGIKYPVTFLKLDQPPLGTRIFPADISHTVLQMLQSVIQEGTGIKAGVPGYHIAGKTGTAYIASQRGYDKHRYMSSFVGIAPVSDPQLVVAVVIRDPKGQHFGAFVAAPAFSRIMSGALRMLNIPPDDVSTQNAIVTK